MGEPAAGQDADVDDPLYERLASYEGQPAATAVRGRDPVNAPMIRHWCEALGHPLPADGSAPPTMLQVWTMAGLTEPSRQTDDDAPGGRSAAYEGLLGALDEAGCTSVVATNCEQEYVRTLTPGEEIVFDSVIESVSPRKRTGLGTGYFVTTRMDVRAGGTLVGTHRFRPQVPPGRTAFHRGAARGTGAEGEPAAAPRDQPRQRRLLGGRRA